ncbi:MAG: carboxypeptidase-like regulatory domain-containing protein, partial [Flavobacteriales bacterium]
MKVSTLFLCVLTFSILSIYSQQTVKGKVVDLESQFPLPGVNVQFINGDFNSGVATDINGNFKIENVPLGRKQIRFTFIGYTPQS